MSAGVVTFYCYGATHMILMAFALDKTRKRRTLAGFVLAPIVAFLFAMENFSIGGMVKAEDAGETDPTLSSLRYLVHSFIYPLVLVMCYELGYKVHKTRSVNFCCIKFDEGHRDHNSAFHLLLRGFPHLIAFILWIMTIAANAEHIRDPVGAGATARFSTEGLHFDDLKADLSSIVDITPTIALAVVVSHTGASLWRYGTFYSTDVHATVVNPWIGMLLGVLGVLFSSLFTPSDWELPYATNTAELVLMAFIVRSMSLIDHNLVQCELFEENLRETNAIGRRIAAQKGTDGAEGAVGTSSAESGSDSDAERDARGREKGGLDAYRGAGAARGRGGGRGGRGRAKAPNAGGMPHRAVPGGRQASGRAMHPNGGGRGSGRQRGSGRPLNGSSRELAGVGQAVTAARAVHGHEAARVAARRALPAAGARGTPSPRRERGGSGSSRRSLSHSGRALGPPPLETDDVAVTFNE